MRTPTFLTRTRCSRALLFGLAVLTLPPSLAAARPERLGETGENERSEPALELLVLHATHDQRGIDARLGDLSELKRPPFSAFATYTLLERTRLPLKHGTRTTRRLPNGRSLAAELLSVADDGSARLSASISEPGGSAFLPLLEVRAKVGQRFIVAGQSYRGGILVLVLTLVR